MIAPNLDNPRQPIHPLRSNRMRKQLATLAAIAVISFAAAPPIHAQQKKPAAKTYALIAAHLFDGKSNSLSSPGMVVISGGEITLVGSTGSIPSGAEVID